jgi:predicted transcriptional regulator
MYAAREYTIAQIAEVLGVTRATVYRHLDAAAPTTENQRSTHAGSVLS